MKLEEILHPKKEGQVRMTMSKYINVGEYLQALLMPQFNVPTGSAFDYDTLAPTLTYNIKSEDDSQTQYN